MIYVSFPYRLYIITCTRLSQRYLEENLPVSIIEDRGWIDLLQKITGTWVVCDQVTYQRLQFLRYLPIIHILHCKVVYCDCTLGVRVKSKLDVILCASGIGLVFLQVLFTVLNSVMNTRFSQFTKISSCSNQIIILYT